MLMQVLCTVIVVTGLCDLVKTVVDVIDDSSEIPNYQIISPIVLLLSAVSVCAHVRHFGNCNMYCHITLQALMIAVILSEKNQGIPSSGIQFCFWGALVIYAGIKLRTLILISRDEVQRSLYHYSTKLSRKEWQIWWLIHQHFV